MIVPSFLALIKGLQKLSPTICPLCHSTTYEALCVDCQSLLQPQNGNHCQVCDIEVIGSAPICADCLKSPPNFTQATCAYHYTFPTDRLIQQFKDHYAFHWGTRFSRDLAQRLRERYCEQDWPDLVVPVPMHWSSILKRGYNQSALIALELSRQLKIPYSAVLWKTRRTPPQHLSGATKRRRNISKSFACRGSVKGLRIAVVDDVLTTGTTVNALSKLLIQNGAERVDVWALARTPKSRKY